MATIYRPGCRPLTIDVRRAVIGRPGVNQVRVTDPTGIALHGDPGEMIELAHRLLRAAGATGEVVRLPVLGRIGGDGPEAA